MDVFASMSLHQVLAWMCANGVTTLHVDGRGVTSTDCTFLGTLTGFAQELRRRGGELRLITWSPSLAGLCAIAGLGPTLDATHRRKASRTTVATHLRGA
ncbi:MAG: hypothetical protein JWM12_1995 [Ilumatobacteraceae bacterium]|nr:hypothetical protein [Ilumatobacteraceae bacterium]